MDDNLRNRLREMYADRVEFHLPGQHDQSSHGKGEHGTGVGRDAKGARIARKRRGLFADWRTKRAQRQNDKDRAALHPKASPEFLNTLGKYNHLTLGALGNADLKRYTKGDLAWTLNRTRQAAEGEERAARNLRSDALKELTAKGPTYQTRVANYKQYTAWSDLAQTRAKSWRRANADVRGEMLRRNKTVFDIEEAETFASDSGSSSDLEGWLDVLDFIDAVVEEGDADPEILESAPLVKSSIEAYLDGKFEENTEEGAE